MTLVKLRQHPRADGHKEVLLVAGGTAGHIMAALAVSDALLDQGLTLDQLSYLTADRSLDRELLPESEYQVVRYKGSGITKGSSLLSRLSLVATTLRSSLAILKPIGRWRPKVVVSFGGFYSLMGTLWAKTLGAKIVVVEQNVVLGRANYAVSLLADKVLLAFDDTQLPMGVKRRSEVVGNPVRSEIVSLATAPVGPRASSRERLGIQENEVVLVVTSGSLGARSINAAVAELLRMLDLELDRSNLTEKVKVVHFQGKTNQVKIDMNEQLGIVEYEVRDFDPDLYLWLGAADLVISRAGTSTLFELFALGVPAIYVPLPKSPKDHQELNARYAKGRGAAQVVLEGDEFPRRLFDAVRELIFHAEKRKDMAAASTQCAYLGSAKRVAEVAVAFGASAKIDRAR